VGRSDFKSEWGSETVQVGFDSRSLPPARSGMVPGDGDLCRIYLRRAFCPAGAPR